MTDTTGPTEGVTGEWLLESDRLDVPAFYEHVWRRRPMIWRGCGSDFLAPSLDWPRIAEVEQLSDEGLGASQARRSPDGKVLFVNQAQHTLPELATACGALAETFGWSECTADLSVTRGQGAGIGCHFDHSDNFVVQQRGSKSWRVGLPTDTAPHRQRARMLETKGFVPSGTLPKETREVELFPGDVLYLPLFAPHEGVESAADDGSISVSFSHNAQSAISRLLKPLLRRLSEEEAWWGPVPLDGSDPDQLAQALHRALVDVLDGEGPAAHTTSPSDPAR